MNEEMKIIREVNNQAELFYKDAEKMGNDAAQVLGASETGSHRSQITGLEHVAESALKPSDVFDYIKRQTARLEGWQRLHFGDRLRGYLDQTLLEKVSVICTRLEIGNTTNADAQQRRRIHLLLIRQFLRQMAVEYEYRVSQSKQPKTDGR